MKKVPQKIIDKANKCPFDYACIASPEHHVQCDKIHKGIANLIEIIPKEPEFDIESHPYFVALPNAKTYYCVCPVFEYVNK